MYCFKSLFIIQISEISSSDQGGDQLHRQKLKALYKIERILDADYFTQEEIRDELQLAEKQLRNNLAWQESIKTQHAMLHKKRELRKNHRIPRKRGMVVDSLEILNQQLDPIPQNQMKINRQPAYNAIELRHNVEDFSISSQIPMMMVNNLEEQRRMYIPPHLANTERNSFQLLRKMFIQLDIENQRLKKQENKIRYQEKIALKHQIMPSEALERRDQNKKLVGLYQNCQKQKMRYSRQLIASQRENVQLLKSIHKRQKQHQTRLKQYRQTLFSRQQRIIQLELEVQELKSKIQKESEAINLLRVKMLQMQIDSSKCHIDHVPRDEQLYYLRNKVATQQEEYHKLVVQLDQMKTAKMEMAELIQLME